MHGETLVYTDVAFASSRERHCKNTAIASLIVILGNGLFWGYLSYRFDANALIAVNLSFGALCIPVLLLYKRLPLSALFHITFLIAFSYVWVMLVVEGVPAEHLSLHWWFLGTAMGSLLLFFDAPRWRAGYTFISVTAFVACEFTLLRLDAIHNPSARFIAGAPAMQQGVHFSVFVSVLILSGVFAASIAAAEAHLARANSILESILGNMLPPRIAERLRREGRTFADGYADCSVLFVDLAGFTTLASELSPAALVRLLDDIFSRFDDLTEKHGLEKIKTIGDGYMVAAGIPEPRPDHAHACVALATDMRAVIREYAGLKARIGINSGSVIAGIIGKRKFIYDLWGDTVNIAAQMENHGIVDEIQVSDATAQLIEPEYETTPRGVIEVKGKRAMRVHLVVGRRIERRVHALAGESHYDVG
jgi:class 3 adenylate cyclase